MHRSRKEAIASLNKFRQEIRFAEVREEIEEENLIRARAKLCAERFLRKKGLLPMYTHIRYTTT